MKRILICSILSLMAITLFGQSEVVVPAFDDTYSEYVKKLESGNTDIDYQDFRFSFMKSKQFKIASQKLKDISQLKNAMSEQMDQLNYDGIISLAKQILSIDYTNMMAHKILSQTYDMMEDADNSEKYDTIGMGLLKSIIQNGDGKSCETAWPVIQVSEEYFILEMLGVEVKQQSIINSKGLCDRMDVTDEGVPATYYFDISKIFENRDKY
ncbi:DUF4919 domain-containing protein [Dysgonomonas sp. HDW5A]|uniref:DUF4919 domain-containing protein n=1 Tax=Dysgonomonas sp. HDW5A TaxID=2714926 RepID=UPI00140C2F0E|nr:DUF4919 domain-containing protein [Dysgonomonas sp. HDW5A]QIK59676.1 DUF4919 domain-containing protein [Dysgonomonas sp. HDW5A]